MACRSWKQRNESSIGTKFLGTSVQRQMSILDPIGNDDGWCCRNSSKIYEQMKVVRSFTLDIS
jgi:hypothetical protein